MQVFFYVLSEKIVVICLVLLLNNNKTNQIARIKSFKCVKRENCLYCIVDDISHASRGS